MTAKDVTGALSDDDLSDVSCYDEPPEEAVVESTLIIVL